MESQKQLTDKDMKISIIEQFEEDELTIFYVVMLLAWSIGVSPCVSRSKVESYLYNRIKTKTLCQFTVHILDLQIPENKLNNLQITYRIIYDNKSRLRDAVFSYYNEHIKFDIKKRASASNSQVGEVAVTVNALECFQKYATYSMSQMVRSIDEFTYEFLVEQFQIVFGNAKEVDIDPSLRVRRIINNNFEKARYFVGIVDETLQLRFVVTEKTSSLVNVEIDH